MSTATWIEQHILSQGYELLVDQDQLVIDEQLPSPVVLRNGNGRDILDLSHPHIEHWLAQLGYELSGAVMSRGALKLALVALAGRTPYERLLAKARAGTSPAS